MIYWLIAIGFLGIFISYLPVILFVMLKLIGWFLVFSFFVAIGVHITRR